MIETLIGVVQADQIGLPDQQAAVHPLADAGPLVVGDARGHVDQIGFAGALHDPVAALVFCTPANVAYSIINGKVVVRDGQLVTLDLPLLVERHNGLALALAQAAR